MALTFKTYTTKWKNTGMVMFWDSNGNKLTHEVDGVTEDLPYIDPSVIEWGYSDISGANAGRDEKGTMHPMKIGSKVQYKLEWNHIDPAHASYILKAINSGETFYAQLYDPAQGDYVKRLFYVGDRSAPFKIWRPANGGPGEPGTDFTSEPDSAIFTKLSFTIIEV